MATITATAGAGTADDPLDAVDAALSQALPRLAGRTPDLAGVFLGAAHAAAAEVVAEVVRARSGAAHLFGGTAGGVVADAAEHEDPSAVAVWLACLPGADLVPLRYGPPLDAGPPGLVEGPAGPADGWQPPPEDAAGLLLLADAATFPADGFCAWLAQARPGLPVAGGLAIGPSPRVGARLLLDDVVHDGGAVAVAVGGAVAVRTLVSQGCRPVGDSYVVTRADRNLLAELAGRPPVERLRELYAAASEVDRALLREGLHVGLVIDEYAEDPGPGDFLVRAVLGAERDGGGIAVGDVVRVGQTVRFHVRDAASADADLTALLRAAAREGPPAAALLFTCNGRGERLFGVPHHDAAAVSRTLGDVGLAGCFCAGEIGPVGGRSFLHGFTASLIGFVPVDEAPAASPDAQERREM